MGLLFTRIVFDSRSGLGEEESLQHLEQKYITARAHDVSHLIWRKAHSSVVEREKVAMRAPLLLKCFNITAVFQQLLKQNKKKIKGKHATKGEVILLRNRRAGEEKLVGGM